MKKYYVLLIMIAFFTGHYQQAEAQCTPDPNCVDLNEAGEMCPDSLAEGYVNEMYEQIVTIIPPDSFMFMGNPVYLSHIKILEINNLPDGLNWETNATDNLFAIGSSYCAVLSGTPLSDGAFTLEVVVQPYVLNIPLPYDITDDSSLVITVHPANSIASEFIGQSPKIAPNPVSNNFRLSTWFTRPATGTFCLYNSLGNEILRSDINAGTGEQHFEFRIPDCPSGIYFYRLKTDFKTWSGKLIKK